MKIFNVKRQMRRVSSFQLFIAGAVILNLIVFIILSHRRQKIEKNGNFYTGKNFEQVLLKKALSNPEPGLAVVLYEYEFFDNRVADTVKNVHEVFPSADIVVISSTLPYPPLKLPTYAKHVVLKVPLDRSELSYRLEMYITKEHVLIIPDAHQIITEESVRWMISELEKQETDVKMIAWSANAMRDVKCLGLQVDLKRWTLKYYRTRDVCDVLRGTFFLLIKRQHLFSLAKPFARPQSDAFFIQTTLRGWKVKYRDDFTFRRGEKLFQDPHLNWKHKNREEHRLNNMYKDFGIKLVKSYDGGEKWMGCSKDSQRCFGTVVNDVPEYITAGRWTPPCCLNALRLTARHVFAVLENQGVRYWLEGGSLLGAVRHSDIIPWDYDVDIGIYHEDIPKCMHLLKCDFQPFEDQDGFVWERAKEGDFFRVQFSSSNRLHVDIYPFTSRNGTMTKNTWMKTHRQDKEFPEHFLNPLVKLDFVGIQASAPNNYKKFLEYKFGEGVIENPKYPDDTIAV